MLEKQMTILYEVHHNLYINLTNQCPCACVFCLRKTKDELNHSGSLWLDHEPSIQEVMDEFKKFDISKYEELVFCGFGEPCERLDDLLLLAAYIKKSYNKPIRVNTNGLADLMYGKDTTPLFYGLVDTISISLNTPNAQKDYELTRNKFGMESFDAMLKFAENVKKYVPKVIFTTVDTTLTKEEEGQCAEICEKIGVTYRIRPWED